MVNLCRMSFTSFTIMPYNAIFTGGPKKEDQEPRFSDRLYK